MKRSVEVSTPLLASVALVLLTGCHRPEPQRCVDEQNHIVPDSFCNDAGRLVPGRGPSGMAYPVPLYRYYYGGSGGGVGSTVFGGSYAALPGHSYADSSGHSSGTVRGGFGSSHGGSEGGGEGNGGEGGGGAGE